ncbi:ankyrin repeat domain-containing protein [Halanaerobacter jeridensis]|uniref:Ankyrin repeat protein n=1 Tax=Halanaerobacter jeridensis TaxID=706427 RepID=A0A938XW94_9FIRM|nr:ankyrin repeat domain-containing protein [Halanaerobacter jeridensis]MBM7557411.1 hypothetical protein [Halanaerobacter jeridensis]
MLEKNSCQHKFSAAELKQIDKRINLQFELKSRSEIEQLILKAINLLLSTDYSSEIVAEVFQDIFKEQLSCDKLEAGEIKYIVYDLLETADKDNFWTYNFLIKLINKLNYLQGEGLNSNLKQQLISYFSKRINIIENELYVMNQSCATEVETVINLVFKLWEQYEEKIEEKDLLLIKLQLQELDLNPHQAFKIKDFYKYLNNNSELCVQFTSNIAQSEYNKYDVVDMPLVSGLIELDKLINNNNQLCKTIVDKMNGLGIDYDQEEFNLEILNNYLSEEANFNLEQELDVFHFIVELLTDLIRVSINKKKRETGQELIEAIKAEDLTRAKELINSEVEVNIKDKEGRTPLIWAAEKGQEELMMKLMKAGAKLDATDDQGRTVLSRIHSCYQMEVMQRLNQNSN